MNKTLFRLNLITTLLFSSTLCFLLFAEDKDDDLFKEFDTDLIEDANRELHKFDKAIEALDPAKIAQIFEEIKDAMHGAAERIIELNDADSIKNQEEAVRKIEELLSSITKNEQQGKGKQGEQQGKGKQGENQDSQKNGEENSSGGSITDKISKLAKSNQDGAVEGIEKLIKIAKQLSQAEQMSGSSSSSSRQDEMQMPEDNDNSKDPAHRPYEVNKKESKSAELPKIFGSDKRWGVLPDRLRDQLPQSSELEYPVKYRDEIERFSKIIGGSRD